MSTAVHHRQWSSATRKRRPPMSTAVKHLLAPIRMSPPRSAFVRVCEAREGTRLKVERNPQEVLALIREVVLKSSLLRSGMTQERKCRCPREQADRHLVTQYRKEANEVLATV